MESIESKKESPVPTSTEVDEDVLHFLKELNLTELSDIFKSEQLIMEDVIEMSNHDLQLIGVVKHKQRRTILKACEDIKQKTQSKVVTEGSVKKAPERLSSSEVESKYSVVLNKRAARLLIFENFSYLHAFIWYLHVY